MCASDGIVPSRRGVPQIQMRIPSAIESRPHEPSSNSPMVAKQDRPPSKEVVLIAEIYRSKPPGAPVFGRPSGRRDRYSKGRDALTGRLSSQRLDPESY